MASGLATRCNACGTVFRVVPDQLRVSDGWVRCGRCAQVFNAAEALLDLETGAPRLLADLAPPPAAAGSATVDFPLDIAPPAGGQRADVELDEPGFAGVRAVGRAAGGAGGGAGRMPVVDDSASRFAGDAADAAAAAPDPRAEPDDRPPATPSFVVQAERARRWRSPAVRAALAAVALVGALGLGAQALYAYRDLAAARFEPLGPLLAGVCAWGGCQVGPARSINDLAVESSGLVRVEQSNIYRLSVALRNRAGFALALPALELSLTDPQGQLMARRVLTTTELGVNQATLAAGRELTLQATLQAAGKPEAATVAGYTIELFYP
jgi:predicted Zn finger-like uncharacterized protein